MLAFENQDGSQEFMYPKILTQILSEQHLLGLNLVVIYTSKEVSPEDGERFRKAEISHVNVVQGDL